VCRSCFFIDSALTNSSFPLPFERTEIKSAVKKSSSNTKAQASSWSAGRAAKSEKEVDVLADESGCSSSQVDSQASISSYKDGSTNVHNTGFAVTTSPVMHAPQSSVFQHSDHIPVSNVIYEEQSKVLDFVSLSSSSAQRYSDSDESFTTTEAEVANSEHAEAMYSHDQPFSSDDLMYLASIFENDEHQSHGDLSSTLSLNEETSAEAED